MPTNRDVAKRIETARLTGHYEPLREEIQRYVNEGRSQRWVALKMDISRQTIVIAAKALGIVFPRNVETMLAGRRHLNEFLAKVQTPAVTHWAENGTNRQGDPLVRTIRRYTAAWDRGW